MPIAQSLGTCDEPPLVSIIVAAHNAERYIEETCMSALSQTYASLELIVVDDGSTDSTGCIVDALAMSDPRVRLIRQQNLGVAAARNCAIAAASGEFIAPLDADDLWDPTKIELQVRRMQECGPETGLVYCWSAWIDENGSVLDRPSGWRIEGRALEQLVDVNFTGNSSVPLYRRSFFQENGGYNVQLRLQGCQGCEDWDLALRVAERFAASVVPAVLVGYRRRTDSMSSECETMWRSWTQIMADLATRQPELPAITRLRTQKPFGLHLAGVSFFSGNYLQAVRWALCVRPLTLLLAVLCHVPLVLARHFLCAGYPRPKLIGRDGYFDACALSEPQIPYDRIFARYWSKRESKAGSSLSSTPA